MAAVSFLAFSPNRGRGSVDRRSILEARISFIPTAPWTTLQDYVNITFWQKPRCVHAWNFGSLCKKSPFSWLPVATFSLSEYVGLEVEGRLELEKKRGMSPEIASRLHVLLDLAMSTVVSSAGTFPNLPPSWEAANSISWQRRTGYGSSKSQIFRQKCHHSMDAMPAQTWAIGTAVPSTAPTITMAHAANVWAELTQPW